MKAWGWAKRGQLSRNMFLRAWLEYWKSWLTLKEKCLVFRILSNNKKKGGEKVDGKILRRIMYVNDFLVCVLLNLMTCDYITFEKWKFCLKLFLRLSPKLLGSITSADVYEEYLSSRELNWFNHMSRHLATSSLLPRFNDHTILWWPLNQIFHACLIWNCIIE